MKKNLLLFSLLLAGIAVTAQSTRLSLYEEFTGENCGPCASANPGLNAKLADPVNASKIVAIKWEVPIPSAPSATWSLYQTNKNEINWRYRSVAQGGYGYGITSAPSGLIDGQNCSVFGAASNHPNSLTNGAIATAQSYTSAFTVNITREWNRTCSAVNLTVDIQATAPFTAVGALVFRTIMVERSIEFNTPPGSNGEKTFKDVGIRSFPNIQNGTALPSSWTIGQTQTFTMSCEVPSYTRKKTEIAIVGIIQDDGNRKVAQAARADKEALPQEALSIMGADIELSCGAGFTPTVAIKNEGTSPITALSIIPYVDGIPQTPFPWSGSIAPGATENIPVTGLTAISAAGTHTFMYEVDINTPYNLVMNNNKSIFFVISGYQSTPVVEGFSGATFPPANWGIGNANGANGWSKTNLTGSGDSFSTKCDFFGNGVPGDKDELYLPPMNLTGGNNPLLVFDRAHALKTVSSSDKLEIFASSDCGVNWTSVFERSGNTLATILNPYPTTYLPENATHWTTEYVELPGFNKSEVIVKFVATASGAGNNLYLDNINLLQADGTGLSKFNNNGTIVSLYPNPANDQVKVDIVSDRVGDVSITVLNTIGQVVYTTPEKLQSGVNTFNIRISDLPAGIYHVKIQAGDKTILNKLSIAK